jgi:hypothetical protein
MVVSSALQVEEKVILVGSLHHENDLPFLLTSKGENLRVARTSVAHIMVHNNMEVFSFA